ncbi:MAG: restriction endonuclease [Desulfomonile tiedjei]|nr:restriction endonuclease [Desulfomonile tiedjei]
MDPFSLDHLTPTEFEEFCYDLLHELGFVNVDWRKGTGLPASPSDRGRDIECERRVKEVDGKEHTEKWFVECKHHKKGVSPDKLDGALTWATAKRPDWLLIIVSNFLSNPAKEYLQEYSQSNRPTFKIRYWEKPDLGRLVAGKGELIRKYRIQLSDRPCPASKEEAIERLKKLAQDKNRIGIHDFVRQRTDELVISLAEESLPPLESTADAEKLEARLQECEAKTDTLSALFANGIYWTGTDYDSLWVQSLERAANLETRGKGASWAVNIPLYPALILLYSGCIGAMAKSHYDMVATLLLKPRIPEGSSCACPALALTTCEIMEKHKYPRGAIHWRVPLSRRLYGCLGENLKRLFSLETDYQTAFDTFECLLGMVNVDLALNSKPRRPTEDSPLGLFAVRHDDPFAPDYGQSLLQKIVNEATSTRDAWPPLKAGLFEGSMERFLMAASRYKQEFELFQARRRHRARPNDLY